MIDRIKVRLFLEILFSCSLSTLLAQNEYLKKGDSLFAQQKYIEAFEKYELLFSNGQASSAMLLKMAFIQDELGNYTDALFFLDKYYQESADINVAGKIEELAKANDLEGYRYEDIDYFLALLYKYRTHFTFLLSVMMLMLLVYIFQKSNENARPVAASIIQIIIVVCLFAVANFNTPRKAIIVSDETLLRSGPSAGAEPIEFLAKGHKVKVLERNDVWTRIAWDGREVYVRNGKLRII